MKIVSLQRSPEGPANDGIEREANVRNALIHVLIFLALLVALSAFAIWFNLGPVAHSAAG